MRGWKSLRKTYRVPFLAQFSCNKPHEWILRLSLPSSKIKVNEARVINLFFLPWRPIERNPVHFREQSPSNAEIRTRKHSLQTRLTPQKDDYLAALFRK